MTSPSTASHAGSYAGSAGFPVSQPSAILSYSPLTFPVRNRPVPLELKVSAPVTGAGLPVVLLSHGHGMANFLSSLRGYGPLVDFLAAHGFVVVQPTHLDSTVLELRDSGLPDAPLFMHDRVTDLHFILDHLEEVLTQVPGLAQRVDTTRIAAIGHSLGGATVSQLLGAQVRDPGDPRGRDLRDPRVQAGVMIGAPGLGYDLAPWASENYPVLKHLSFDTMTGTGLVVAGDEDLNPSFSDRLSYRWDAFTHSPAGNKTLLTIAGAGHLFGGISGYDAAETSDEDPARVAGLRALVWAYLRSQLFPGDTSWQTAGTVLQSQPTPIARIDTE